MSLIVILGIGALILFVWVCFSVSQTINRVVVTRSFYCPVRERWVTAEFQEDTSDGKRVEVDWCTSFLPAAAIDCDKACLGFDELSAPIASKCGRVAVGRSKFGQTGTEAIDRWRT